MASGPSLVRLFRIRDWLHFIPLPLAGWVAAEPRRLSVLCGGIATWICALAYTSAVNQAYDDRLDQLARDKNPVGHGIDRAQALRLAAVPLVIVISFLATRDALPVVLIQLFAATAYSAPPRLKRVPILGTTWNLVVGLPGLFFANPPALGDSTVRILFGLFAVTLLVSQLIHEAEDVEDDTRGGIWTFAAMTGTRGAISAACLLLLGMPILGYVLDDLPDRRVAVAVICGLFSAAWIVMLARRLLAARPGPMRPLRLRYRYAALAFGAIVFIIVAGFSTASRASMFAGDVSGGSPQRGAQRVP
jgi:4-hydroxybenzoate polyprenyltransferase